MNKRIKELAEQATTIVDTVNSQGYSSSYANFDREKFAELLIQQCMACSTWVGKNNTNSVEPVHTAHAINQRIKQQFGVEE
jgi:hypothetical protein